MKLLMLCREPRLYSCQRLKQASEQRGYQLDILDPSRFLLKLAEKEHEHRFSLCYQLGEIYDKDRPKPQKIEHYQAVLPRFGPSTTYQGCNVLQHFEYQNITVLNKATAILLARDKWRSLQALAAANIPIPDTLLAGECVVISDQLAHLSEAIVIKTLSGSQGAGIMLAEQQQVAKNVLEILRQSHIPHLSQSFIAEAKGQDIRAFVIDNQVVGAMQRQSKAGDFRANIHQGGTAKSITLTESESELAIKATQILGLDVAGVDLIRSHSGSFVLEVNASPGLEMIEKVSGVDIAGKMIDYLLALMKEKDL